MKIKNIGFTIFGLISICLFLFGFSIIKTGNIAYVDNALLFQGFEGKVEKEAEINIAEREYKLILDSLEIELKAFNERNLLQENGMAGIYNSKVEYYNDLKNELAYKLSGVRDKHSDEVWTQINQYVKDFGAENDYEMILGALGNGSLMYAREKVDITEEVLTYINKRYQGYEK